MQELGPVSRMMSSTELKGTQAFVCRSHHVRRYHFSDQSVDTPSLQAPVHHAPFPSSLQRNVRFDCCMVLGFLLRGSTHPIPEGCTLLTVAQGSMFSSKPISSSWELPGHRTGHSVIDYPVFLLSLAAINMTFDLVLVCLPLFVISRLHLDKRRKWAVAGIFLLGGL